MRKIDLACIVEDDPMHLFITKKYMELSGFVEKILVCKNGKEAYDTLKAMFLNSEKLPQIIFLDLNMPIWDGWQFLDEFTKIPIEKNVIIYILTSSNSEEDINRAEQYSLMSNYLIKPINQSQLKSVLAEFVNN
ncbi:response regulator [Ulvibacter litoralis]|uniref:Response regulator receiver domain-containing protein n=1 Tax=Ulvibacter litoralis TaxID=227084 RepID=A0A1G7H3W3_9FLAO|nr:response regulator [Ulvibacter litoralis]GHC58990.1 response regulator [Ulvibacter litoralis]SDE94993.1 Response regulator receiver domain-containing protein [Ulvibacter litoralis]